MRLNLHTTLPLVFTAALAGLVGNALVAHRNVAELEQSGGQVAHSHEIQDALEKLLSTVKDAETGQRGFLITNKPEYLLPYQAGVDSVHQRLDRVRALTADAAGHAERQAELVQLINAKLDEMARVLEVYQAGRPADARDLVLSGVGRELMTKLRDVVAAMQGDEGVRLVGREDAARGNVRRAMAMNILGGSVGVVMVGLAFYLFRREMAVRERGGADLRRANDLLEQRVQERTDALRQAVDGLVVEVGERKRAEEQATALADALRRSNNELQQFASVASHDLQEPLRKIQAFGDRLASQSAALGETGQDSLQRMLAAASRMRTLINDLLAFSRVATKAQAPVSVDLAVVARDVISDLDGCLQQTAGRVELAELPTIEAEPTQMRQLLQNLVGNALKFHRPNVPPVVRITSRVAANGEPPYCELTVSDNGIGFDEKYLDRIFTVFQRLHGRGKYEGTGIGLAICRKIVEQHGGTITARSQLGEGSTFIAKIPLTRPSLTLTSGATQAQRSVP